MTFKVCTGCGHEWESRAAFLGDPCVHAVGYQVNFEWLRAGYFLFNHCRPDCKTTLSLPAVIFFDLYEGPAFERRSVSNPACPGHCLHRDIIDKCPASCECAFVREILQTITKWPKATDGQSGVVREGT